ncbi:DUF3168 domain-containing protein [Novosphingobium sp. AP12]|uniref:DUF3168 domain-containing protein n=1 Tax=Novosphingobium sp. AP12 TaxID=1144305 RepID=UPI000271DDFE|nr:DUF3168 domain-containing protein [Novosphingobium sp. AP12]EJL21896.1 hypothetical protein PMI02_04881 [Novosphingobium sp. AP12]
MDGVAAIRSVLIADDELRLLVPEDDTSAGPRGLGASLPSIMLESVSTVDRNIPSPGASRHVHERVQVTVMARNYPEQKALLRAVKRAAADQVNPEVAGIADVTIHTAGAGPDLMAEEASIWIGSQDFITTYTESR